MTDTIKFTIDTIGLKNKYFLDSTEFKDILELINVQERPIKIYKDCTFDDILVIEKEKDHFKFLMNTLTPKDRTEIDDMTDFFFDTFTEDGIWIYDFKNNVVVYDFVKKKVKGNWGIFVKEPHGNYFALDNENSTPIKFYNSQNKSALFWGMFYINRHLSNPLGSLADEAGIEIMLKFISSIFNLESFTNFYYHKQEILNTVGIWEKKYEDIDKKYFKLFEKMISEKKVEEKKEEKVETGLTLSKDGKIFLSDLVKNPIPKDFFPIYIDLVLDPRILGACVEGGKILFSTRVTFNEKEKEAILFIMKDNKENVEIKSAGELDSMMEIQDHFSWYDKMFGKGGTN